ncbi:MAG: helix-turn-helix transcriptional regulator [Thalassobaculales bacterium]
METNAAIAAFAALAQDTRLGVFRLLMAHEPAGLAAGEIARQIGVPHNTMSAHLAVLGRAGLVAAERRSRSIIYRARPGQVRALASFLVSDCCGGRPEICGPLVAEFTPCCPPGPAAAEETLHG